MRISLAACSAVFAAALVFNGSAYAQAGGQPTSPSVTPSIDATGGAAPSAYVWAGTWFSNNYAGGYGGFLKALNSDDSLWDDGFVLRGDISGGQYTYDHPPGFNDVSVGTIDVDALVGYREKTDVGTFGVYLGPSIIGHYNPDPAASLRGTQVGVSLIGEYSHTMNQNLEIYAQGRYDSPFSTYSAAGRLLYKISDTVWLGPQLTLYGNKDPYQEYTVGPFVKFNTNFGEVAVSAGYRHPNNDNPDGYFATAYVAFPL